MSAVNSTLEWARQYHALGFAPIPVPPREKAPRIPHWQNLIIPESRLPQYFSNGSNIGLLNGQPSNWIIDIDIDSSIALKLASNFLPATEMIHGRVSKRSSHWWYSLEEVPHTTKFQNTEGQMLLEIRSTGSQTIVPPSVHPSGEEIIWDHFGQPARIDFDDLQTMAHLAACSLLVCHWPEKGSRHDAALACAGLILRIGLPPEDAIKIVSLAAREAGDEEWEARAQCVEDSAKKLSEGKPVTGGPRLAELLKGNGANVVEKINTFLGTGPPGDGSGATQPNSNSTKPRIDVGNRDLAHLTDQAWSALKQANEPPFIFRRGGIIARIERDDEENAILRDFDKDRMRHVLARCADWYQVKNQNFLSEMPPLPVVLDLLADPDPPLPILNGINTCPVFSRSGVLHMVEGYHPESRLYVKYPKGFKLPTISEKPGPEDLKNARALLRNELLGDFPFVGNPDIGHAMAFLLLPFVRPMVDGPTPLHLIHKPTPGTGATLLAHGLSYPGTGRPLSAMTEARNEEEWRKRITAALLAGPSVILLDNLRQSLDSAALSSALTTDYWEDRKLGQSDIVRMAVRCGWIATGNNPSLSSEISRRTVRIGLDASVEKPHLRDGFRHPDLRKWVQEHRGELVWAALTIVQAWINAGRPIPVDLPSFGSFESYRDVIGGILEVAGIEGFLGNISDIYEESDFEGDAHRAFVASWWTLYKDRLVGVDKLLPIALKTDIDIGEGGPRSQAIRLGFLLVKLRGRIFDGKRVVRGRKYRGAQQWHLSTTKP